MNVIKDARTIFAMKAVKVALLCTYPHELRRNTLLDLCFGSGVVLAQVIYSLTEEGWLYETDTNPPRFGIPDACADKHAALLD